MKFSSGRKAITPDNLAGHIERRIRKTGTCWEWIGTINQHGYGILRMQRKDHRAHRLTLALAGVEVPTGMMVDHRCRNRACVNPAHLRVVDPKTNTLENSDSIAAINAAKTHCKNGHPFTPENTYLRRDGNGFRGCAACNREGKRRAASARPQCPGHERHLFRTGDACVRCGTPKRLNAVGQLLSRAA